jgi:hypothetical protein
MALRDISNVTQTLMNLIGRAFTVPGAWSGPLPVTVLPEPPIRSKTDGIGMFLYHMVEHPHYKNLPPPGRDLPPVRYTSLALTLYYQLSSYKALGGESEQQDGLMEQQMMAVGMKALHDYPEITDDTFVEGAVDLTPVFPIDIIGRSNRFKIIYQPIQANESISYWTTGDSRLTLSAYYEVNIVLLEPEVSRIASGKVLDYNVFTFLTGNPKILSSSSQVSFTSPADGRTRTLITQPAQVQPAPAVLPPDLIPFELTLKGIDFIGDIILRLTNTNWDEPATTDAGWQLERTVDEITVLVRETAIVESSGAPVDILPGIYGAQVVCVSTKYKSDGSAWPIELTSNVSPFAVVPRIDNLGVPVALGAIATVTGYRFSAVVMAEELIDVRVFIGPTRLMQVAGVPAAGEFQITSATTFDYRLPASVASGDVLPFRVFGNGAESSPQWITAP